MKVRYSIQAKGFGISSRDVHESIMDIDDLPPLAARWLREDGLTTFLDTFYEFKMPDDSWEAFIWVRPV